MNELFNIFISLGYDKKYFRQGSLNNDGWEESFFTYWNISSPGISYRDNKLKKYSEDFMVYFYTNNLDILYSEMERFMSSAKEAGFITSGKSYDAPSGRNDYYGRCIQIRIIKEEK